LLQALADKQVVKSCYRYQRHSCWMVTFQWNWDSTSSTLLTLKSFSPRRPLLDGEYLSFESLTVETL